MHFHYLTELLQLSHEIEQLRIPDSRSASDEAGFIDTKAKVLGILRVLYGEKSREFRVVKLTYSPATVVKVVNYIISSSDRISPQSKAVNM
ncbi:hypothetical protein [Desulfosporosinus hippei]|uniref:Uncharacterized protein n=1 Tax=Desulfosporosinus hippei DSM 8344 TaxID=1121419 RepID=A0A1G8FD71_9FIRM|nr:hypothetical protein [Desulfosporosinus hippei]SDH80067.1 hypothetical protein SAMN05443529_11953 [Desulfosporosinus hippei DSM 8344]